MGPRNEPEVQIDVKKGPVFDSAPTATAGSPPLDALDGTACGPPRAPAPCTFSVAWTWRPALNVELAISGGCIGHDPSCRCAIAVSRHVHDHIETLAQIEAGRQIPQVVLVEGADHPVRMRGADAHKVFFREIRFSYGRVDVSPMR
jgi:hypothetical protein